MQQSDKRKFQDIKRTLDQKNYETIKSIGKGAFGQVLMVRCKKQGNLFAVKVINKAQVRKKPFLQKYIDQEIQIMGKLAHQNIVQQKNTFKTNDFIFIVMEYCEQGNLLTHQARMPGRIYPLPQAVQILVEILKGLKCIHQQKYIHRDIKSENVLLKKITKRDGTTTTQYKIADFGFARPIGGVGAKTHCGTERYMAPEIINNSYYGIAVDIWAVGVLFYFMLFAEYPFRGHDMKTEFERKCNPTFEIANVISKKDKLNDMNQYVEDFFRRIFVIDAKKRINFVDIAQHPVLAAHRNDFRENIDFYKNIKEDDEVKVRDPQHTQEYGQINEMEVEDQSRSALIQKIPISKDNKNLQRELQEIAFEANKILYLKECAIELFQSYSAYLSYPQRLAAQFYLTKAFLFYSQPLTECLLKNELPEDLKEIQISQNSWVNCTQTKQYKNIINTLNQANLKCRFLLEDTYNTIKSLDSPIIIKNFDKGLDLKTNYKSFEDFKFPYRSTTSHIFKQIHNNKKMNSHLRNKIKMRLFCCHMINRIFTRSQLNDNFPYYFKWTQKNHVTYPHSFDFTYFGKWVLQENQEKLQKNINLLHKVFF